MVHYTVIATPAAKTGSSLLCFFLNQHPVYKHITIEENYAMGQMMNTLNWLPPHLETVPGLARPKFISNLRSFMTNRFDGGSEYMAEKWTMFAGFQWLRYVWPESYIIVPIRHPVDCWISYRNWINKWFNFSENPTDWIKNCWIRAAESLAQTKSYHVVYMEDLVLNTDATMNKCWHYMQLPSVNVSTDGSQNVYNIYTSTGASTRSSNLVTDVTRRRFEPNALTCEEYSQLCRAVESSGLLDNLFAPYAKNWPN